MFFDASWIYKKKTFKIARMGAEQKRRRFPDNEKFNV